MENLEVSGSHWSRPVLGSRNSSAKELNLSDFSLSEERVKCSLCQHRDTSLAQISEHPHG